MKAPFVVFVIVARGAFAQVAAGPPPYCEPRKEQWVQKYGPELEEALQAQGLTDQALGLASAAWCEKPADAERQALIAKIRQRMIDELGFTADETVASLRLRQGDAFTKERAVTCAELNDGSQESVSAGAAASIYGSLIGCEARSGGEEAEARAKDLTDEVDPLWSAGLAVECFNTLARAKDDFEKEGNAVRFARCHLLTSLVDRAAFNAALERDERFTAYEKVSAKENLAFTLAADREFVEFWRPRMAKNPVLRELFIEAPKQGYERWALERQANRAAWATVISVETQFLQSKGAPADCTAEIRPVLGQLFKNDAVEIPEWPSLWAGQSLKRRAVQVLGECEAAAGHSNFANAFWHFMPHSRADDTYGPIGAGMRALHARFLVAAQERPKFAWYKTYRLMPPEDPSYDPNPPHYSPPSNSDEAPIKAVQRKGETAVITFNQQNWSEFRPICTSTNKIFGIDPVTGDIRYERHCDTSETIQHSKRQKPITVAKEYANGLKAGQLLVFVRAENDKGLSLPTVSFSSSKKTKVATVLGQPTK